MHSILYDSRKLSGNCCTFDRLLSLKNAIAFSLNSFGIVDPLDQATSIIFWTLSSRFLMNCLGLMIGFVSMYTKSPGWSLRMLQSFQMVIGLLLIDHLVLVVLFLCHLWWFLYIFIIGSDLIYWTSYWLWRLDLAIHYEESPI